MSSRESGVIGFDVEFFKSTDGVFKVVQLVSTVFEGSLLFILLQLSYCTLLLSFENEINYFKHLSPHQYIYM